MNINSFYTHVANPLPLASLLALWGKGARRAGKGLFILLLLFLPLLASAQNQLFGAYQTRSDVRYVCIDHTMLQQMQQSQPLTIGEYALTPIIDMLETVLIIRSDKAKAITQMSDDSRRLRSDREYLTVLERNIEGTSSLRFFRRQSRYPAEFIIYQSDSHEALFIVLTGTFTSSEIYDVF